jgi:hypothetical protein
LFVLFIVIVGGMALLLLAGSLGPLWVLGVGEFVDSLCGWLLVSAFIFSNKHRHSQKRKGEKRKEGECEM